MSSAFPMTSAAFAALAACLVAPIHAYTMGDDVALCWAASGTALITCPWDSDNTDAVNGGFSFTYTMPDTEIEYTENEPICIDTTFTWTDDTYVLKKDTDAEYINHLNAHACLVSEGACIPNQGASDVDAGEAVVVTHAPAQKGEKGSYQSCVELGIGRWTLIMHARAYVAADKLSEGDLGGADSTGVTCDGGGNCWRFDTAYGVKLTVVAAETEDKSYMTVVGVISGLVAAYTAYVLIMFLKDHSNAVVRSHGLLAGISTLSGLLLFVFTTVTWWYKQTDEDCSAQVFTFNIGGGFIAASIFVRASVRLTTSVHAKVKRKAGIIDTLLLATAMVLLPIIAASWIGSDAPKAGNVVDIEYRSCNLTTEQRDWWVCSLVLCMAMLVPSLGIFIMHKKKLKTATAFEKDFAHTEIVSTFLVTFGLAILYGMVLSENAGLDDSLAYTVRCILIFVVAYGALLPPAKSLETIASIQKILQSAQEKAMSSGGKGDFEGASASEMSVQKGSVMVGNSEIEGFNAMLKAPMIRAQFYEFMSAAEQGPESVAFIQKVMAFLKNPTLEFCEDIVKLHLKHGSKFMVNLSDRLIKSIDEQIKTVRAMPDKTFGDLKRRATAMKGMLKPAYAEARMLAKKSSWNEFSNSEAVMQAASNMEEIDDLMSGMAHSEKMSMLDHVCGNALKGCKVEDLQAYMSSTIWAEYQKLLVKQQGKQEEAKQEAPAAAPAAAPVVPAAAPAPQSGLVAASPGGVKSVANDAKQDVAISVSAI